MHASERRYPYGPSGGVFRVPIHPKSLEVLNDAVPFQFELRDGKTEKPGASHPVEKDKERVTYRVTGLGEVAAGGVGGGWELVGGERGVPATRSEGHTA